MSDTNTMGQLLSRNWLPVLSVIATILGVGFYLQNIDTQLQLLAANQELQSERCENVNTDVDRLEQRQNTLEERVRGVENQTAEINEKLNNIEVGIDEIKKKLP